MNYCLNYAGLPAWYIVGGKECAAIAFRIR